MQEREHEGERTGPSTADRVLRLFGEVRPGESVGVTLLVLALFLQLTAYYFLKVVREPLVMTAGGAEVKRYAAAVQTVLLVVVVQFYSALAARLDRMKLIAAVNGFCVVSLLAFCALGMLDVSIGISFFIWVGVFNVAMVAQFWAFANDLYDRDQGKRLFGVVGVGGAIGAVCGAYLSGWLLTRIGPYLVMAAAAAVLLVYMYLLTVLHRRDGGSRVMTPVGGQHRDSSGLRLLRHDRYLRLVALLSLTVNCVNTIGEYVLDRKLLEQARAAAAGRPDQRQVISALIGGFRARFFGLVNLASLLIQSFLVSRLISRLDVIPSLLVTPSVTLLSYSAMALLPVFGVVAAGKLAENSLGYSLQNTARNALFLVTPTEVKYKGKTIADTFFWRAGDVLSAVLVWAGSRLGLSTAAFIWLNLGLVVGWLLLMRPLDQVYGVRAAAVEAVGAGGGER